MGDKKNLNWLYFTADYDSDNSRPPRNIKFKLFKIFIFAFCKVNMLFIFQLIASSLFKKIKINEYIVLESQAPHHHMNAFRFLKLKPENATFIQTYNKISVTSVKYIGLIALNKEFYRNFLGLRKYILDKNKLFKHEDILVNANQTIHLYTYLCSLFKKIKKEYPNLNIYSGGAELASIASISQGMSTHYLSHGLLGLNAKTSNDLTQFVEQKISSLSFPEYSSIFVYSEFERKYLESQLKNTKIYKYQFQALKNLNKTIILFFEQTQEFFDESKYKNIIDFFLSHNFRILGKEHPTNQAIFPKDFCNKHNIEMLSKNSGTAYEIIEDHSPMFTAGWPSTSLCESLNMGVIPINIPDEHPFFRFKNFYPFQSKTISWKKEFKKIESLVLSKSEYDSCLEKLRED